jgi:biopolymer transport protein ExbD
MAFSASGNGSGGGRSFGRGRFGGGHSAIAEMNIVPLVDVVLVLLIIFMLTAHVMEFGLEIKVPEVKQVKDTAEELPVVSIKSDGNIFLNEKRVNINQIGEEVQKRFPGSKEVYLSADRATIWDPMAQVMSALSEQKLGIKVVVKPEER